MPGDRPPPPLSFRWGPSLIGLAVFAAIGLVGALSMYGGVPATFVAVLVGIVLIEVGVWRRKPGQSPTVEPRPAMPRSETHPPAPPDIPGAPR